MSIYFVCQLSEIFSALVIQNWSDEINGLSNPSLLASLFLSITIIRINQRRRINRNLLLFHISIYLIFQLFYNHNNEIFIIIHARSQQVRYFNAPQIADPQTYCNLIRLLYGRVCAFCFKQ